MWLSRRSRQAKQTNRLVDAILACFEWKHGAMGSKVAIIGTKRLLVTSVSGRTFVLVDDKRIELPQQDGLRVEAHTTRYADHTALLARIFKAVDEGRAHAA